MSRKLYYYSQCIPTDDSCLTEYYGRYMFANSHIHNQLIVHKLLQNIYHVDNSPFSIFFFFCQIYQFSYMYIHFSPDKYWSCENMNWLKWNDWNFLKPSLLLLSFSAKSNGVRSSERLQYIIQLCFWFSKRNYEKIPSRSWEVRGAM